MVTSERFKARLAELKEGDLPALQARLLARATPLMERSPIVPRVKALLSREGGVCPRCGGGLAHDPWSPDRHRCTACGETTGGERQHAHWARAQHLWLAERAAHLAALANLDGDARYPVRASAILRGYQDLYFELPNRDNVLGPSHLFFSTYLESMWITNFLAAAFLLREGGGLDSEIEAGVSAIADEAAQLIGEFDEGISNRQVWHSAALTSIAVWFGDEELAAASIQGRTGLLGLLADGFGDDGMWGEGENYHLFALQGILVGLRWAELAGADLVADRDIARTLGNALMAPEATALPDFTFPARKDSRFGVSLAQPAYLECWELGLAMLGDQAPEELVPWLLALYDQPRRPAPTYDAYLHESGEPARPKTERADLSWWILLFGLPALPEPASPYRPESALLNTQGVGILRSSGRYLSIECGESGGGHGHPDRLHLTVFENGVHWLADPGTGSYLTPDLFWYRSTLAHNAPRLDGTSQLPARTRCTHFDVKQPYGWAVASHGPVRRAVIRGPDWVVDVVELESSEPRLLELPWHLDGDLELMTPGEWRPGALDDPFVTEVRELEIASDGDRVIEGRVGNQKVHLHLVGGTVLRAEGPGRPGEKRRPFFLVRGEGTTVRFVAVLDFGGRCSAVRDEGDRIVMVSDRGEAVARLSESGVTIQENGQETTLGGALPSRAPVRPMISDKPLLAEGQALRVDPPPALDGSLEGFDLSAPLELADEGQYFRSEEPYQGAEEFSARAFVNWDEEALYLGVEVHKNDSVVKEAVIPPQGFDNEPDDINVDGIQVYYRAGDAGERHGFLIRPLADGTVAARSLETGEAVSLPGASALAADGYTIVVALPCAELAQLARNAFLGFDLLVNEARPERVRRAGQLAWGGGGGWIYLRGDRRNEGHWGRLELLG